MVLEDIEDIRNMDQISNSGNINLKMKFEYLSAPAGFHEIDINAERGYERYEVYKTNNYHYLNAYEINKIYNNIKEDIKVIDCRIPEFEGFGGS